MSAAGWTPTKRGWPDFFCVNDAGEVCAVEVKPRADIHLKPEQGVIMRHLSEHGIKCYKWTPDEGLKPWGPEA